jgi:tetratricopeptide (TPR) repeat protein
VKRARLIQFPSRGKALSTAQARAAAERALATPVELRAGAAYELQLEDPELLLAICEALRGRVEASPAIVCEDAEFFFRFLQEPRRPIGLLDERQYFLGELALAVAIASRFLFRRDEAHRWLERSDANFAQTANAAVHFARVAYQRLALSVEERRFEEVLELAPIWSDTSKALGLVEEALKCRFLEALSFRELGQPEKATGVFQEILRDAEALQDLRLEAQAANNLAQLYRVMGRQKEALVWAQKALPLLKQLDLRVHLAKLRWCVGDILREEGKLSESAGAYREALHEAEEIGIRGDVAAIHLVLADVLLQLGQEPQAEWQIRAALPIIEEERMVPEGLAALSLLRESVRRRQIDRQALRSLHGYFRE